LISEVFHALARRWYVLVLGALATLGLIYAAVQASPPEYNARGLVLLLPSESTVGPGGNPFLALSGLEQPAGILVAYFSSASAQQDVAEVAPDAEYEVVIDDSTRGPVIAVSVTDADPRETVATLNHIVDEIPVQLERLQKEVDAPEPAVIGSMVLTIDAEAERDTSGTIRLGIAAAAVGIVLTGVVALALDGLILRRADRHARLIETPSSVESVSVETPTSTAPPKPARVRQGT